MSVAPGALSGLRAGPTPEAPPHALTAPAQSACPRDGGDPVRVAGRIIELRPLELVAGRQQHRRQFLKGYLHPSFANVREYAWQCVVTVCIALWGTVLAVTISVPLGLLGARNLAPHPLVYWRPAA